MSERAWTEKTKAAGIEPWEAPLFGESVEKKKKRDKQQSEIGS